MKVPEINNIAIRKHTALGRQRDATDREAFDVAHRQLWADQDYELQLRLWELEAQPIRTSDDNLELLYLRVQYAQELIPQQKSQAEIIAELLARIETLEAR